MKKAHRKQLSKERFFYKLSSTKPIQSAVISHFLLGSQRLEDVSKFAFSDQFTQLGLFLRLDQSSGGGGVLLLKVESVIKRVPRCEDCYFLKTSLFIYLRFIKCIRVSEEVLLHLLLCDENSP